MTGAREIILSLPSAPEIADALCSIPAGPHHETVRRMAMALDVLRDGGWEFVVGPRPEPPKALDVAPRALEVEVVYCPTCGGPADHGLICPKLLR